MVLELLMSCEVGNRVIIRPSKAPSSLGKRFKNIARSPLQLASRGNKFGCSQKLAFSPKLSQFSPLILAHRVPSWLVDDRSTFHPHRIWYLLAQQYVKQPACVLRRLIRLFAKVSPTSCLPHAADLSNWLIIRSLQKLVVGSK